MEGMIGEIKMFGGNFAPRSWALCEGQLLPISSNTALFSILGTTYGGDGRTTFALPDLRGRVAVQQGNGPGLSSYNLGQKGGAETNTLTVNNLPSHTHTASSELEISKGEIANDDESSAADAGFLKADLDSTEKMTVDATVGNTGGSQAVNNIQPFLAVNYIICLQGIFPSRN